MVAVLGDNRPEWLISELAAQSLGACTVGIYPTSVGEEIVHVLTDGRVRVVVAEDQEQVDKIIELKDQLPTVEKVIYYDTRGLELYEVPYLVEFTAVEASGREWGEAHPGWLDEQVAAGRAADIAVICTTSGTTGRPEAGDAVARQPPGDGPVAQPGRPDRDGGPLPELPPPGLDRRADDLGGLRSADGLHPELRRGGGHAAGRPP